MLVVQPLLNIVGTPITNHLRDFVSNLDKKKAVQKFPV